MFHLHLNPWSAIAIGGSISLFFLLLTLLSHEIKERTKWIYFIGIALPVFATTVFVIGSTVQKNIHSVSGGPVHWHADLLIFNCGVEVDIKNPQGLSNRIGSPLLHEHGDKKIHIEGTYSNHDDVTLQSFFNVIGGEYNHDSIAIPTNESLLVLANDQSCHDGQPAIVQTFVYSVKDGVARQREILDAAEYFPAPHSAVPPGDCVVVEYGPKRAKTDKLCQSYQIAQQKGNLIIE